MPEYKKNEIVHRIELTPSITRMDIYCPRAAKKAHPGHFVILRVEENGERIPLSVSDWNRVEGTIAIIFHVVGATTAKLNQLQEGDCLPDFVAPIGNRTECEDMRRVCVVGGGMGSSIAYPVARELCDKGCYVDSILGFRNKDLVVMEKEFSVISNHLTIMTDDGSYGEKGLVTDALRKQILEGANYDHIITIGPVVMMKFVHLVAEEFGIPLTASMSPIMIDGTGMCGGCRVTVNGERKFACVDGPEFDGHAIDYDELIARGSLYTEQEQHQRDLHCNLFNKEVH